MIPKYLKYSRYLLIITILALMVVSIILSIQNKKIRVYETQLYSHKHMMLTPTQRESDLVLKVTTKGGLSSGFNDGNVYFLVDLKVINNSMVKQKFVVYRCSVLQNVLVDSKELKFLYQNCASNYPELISLTPNQAYTLPIIIGVAAGSKALNKDVKFGFIVLRPKRILEDNSVSTTLRKMRKDQEGVIWSNPITLNSVSGKSWNIMNLQDSTVIE